jgi:lactate dehydrogenase-like 2-hydroxyacid dehydrogenase
MAHMPHFRFGVRILCHAPMPHAPEVLHALGAQACAIPDDVLREADYASLQCPAGRETDHLVDAARLACTPRHAGHINTARGDIVDQAALADALRARRIAGAGLDVYEGEPAISPALPALDNEVLLPQLGNASLETRFAVGRRVLENLWRFFAGNGLRDRVV